MIIRTNLFFVTEKSKVRSSISRGELRDLVMTLSLCPKDMRKLLPSWMLPKKTGSVTASVLLIHSLLTLKRLTADPLPTRDRNKKALKDASVLFLYRLYEKNSFYELFFSTVPWITKTLDAGSVLVTTVTFLD